MYFHSLSDRSPYGGPGGAASARPHKSDRRHMLVADKAIPRIRDIDNSELYDFIKTLVVTIAARPLRIGVVHANLRQATKHAQSTTRGARRNLQRSRAAVDEGTACGVGTTRQVGMALQ